jgi:hypothetical protein
MRYFWTSFGKELYMFRIYLLSSIGSLITVFTATGIIHTSYVDCLLARSGWPRWQTVKVTSTVWQIPVAVNTVLRLLMMNSKYVRNT